MHPFIVCTNTDSGVPPRWAPPVESPALRQDSGDYYRDKNAYRYPSHLMESTVLAALTLNPHLPADIDIVACYSSLGNLVRFILDKDKSFRILVQAVGNTVFFVRRENSPTEKIDDIKGYGHAFPEAYTTWDRDARESDTSHRMLKYQFGGFHMLVRAEADAYIPLPAGPTSAVTKALSVPSTAAADLAGIDQLISGLSSPRLGYSPPTSSSKIAIVPSPRHNIPQSQILEIKTRTLWKKGKEDTVVEELPKLWLAQVPNFVVAYHDRGRFEPNIQVQNVRQLVDDWERTSKRDLACLAALLHRIVGMVGGREDKKLELCRTGMGGLEIREQLVDAGEMLSEETKMKWMDGGKPAQAAGKLTKEDEKSVVSGGALLDIADEVGGEEEKDWTLCSAECGYCGRCRK